MPDESAQASTAAAMTDELAADAVLDLPLHCKQILARGPVPEDEIDTDPDGDCRVCAALDHVYWRNGAAAKLMDWHQGWDLFWPDQTWKFGTGDEVYRRCCVIYEAAQKFLRDVQQEGKTMDRNSEERSDTLERESRLLNAIRDAVVHAVEGGVDRDEIETEVSNALMEAS